MVAASGCVIFLGTCWYIEYIPLSLCVCMCVCVHAQSCLTDKWGIDLTSCQSNYGSESFCDYANSQLHSGIGNSKSWVCELTVSFIIYVNSYRKSMACVSYSYIIAAGRNLCFDR